MTIQTIQFETVSPAEIGSGTVTAFLFSGATQIAELASITENATLKGRHTGTVEDIGAAEYRLVVKFDGYTVSEPDETVALLFAVGTYVSARYAELDTAFTDKFDGITSLADWIRRIARKDAGTAGMATAETEINTGGTATFDGTTDSLEGVRDDLVTAKVVLDKSATILYGTVTGAGTSTEIFTGAGYTATITVDASGNRSAVVFS